MPSVGGPESARARVEFAWASPYRQSIGGGIAIADTRGVEMNFGGRVVGATERNDVAQNRTEDALKTSIKIVYDEEFKSAASEAQEYMSGGSSDAQALQARRPEPQLTDAVGDLKRYEFSDGSVMIVTRKENGEDLHEGVLRSDCENDDLVRALATVRGEDVKVTREFLKFADPVELAAEHVEIELVKPTEVQVSAEIARDSAGEEQVEHGRDADAAKPAIKLAHDGDLATAAGQCDGELSAYAWSPEDLQDHLSNGQMTDEREDGWKRYEFPDGSAIIVRPSAYGKGEDFHVGLERADCENEEVITALASVLDQTVDEARKTARFADPLELSSKHAEIELVDPRTIGVSNDVGRERSEEAGWSM